jgi:hypothetical protein
MECKHITKRPLVTPEGVLLCGECKQVITPWGYDRAQAHMFYVASIKIDRGTYKEGSPPL